MRQLQPRRRRRWVRWAVGLLVAAVLCAVFPPVRIVRLGDAAATQPLTARGLDAPTFWDQRLNTSLDQATDVDALLAEIARGAEAARKQHARQIGLGGAYYYFVRGTGNVVSKGPDGVSVALGAQQEPAVVLESGPIFGNAVRDGTGLLDVSDYANSQDFNALSEELNKLVETRVLPGLRDKANVGSEVSFTGVATVLDESTDLRPLRVVPVAVEVR